MAFWRKWLVCALALGGANALHAQSNYATPYAFTTLTGTAGQAGSVDGNLGGAQFNNLRGITMDTAGNIYVADTGNNTIRKIAPGGTVITLAGSPGQSGSADGLGGAARFNAPAAVAVDAAGNVYVADTGNDIVRVITPAGVVTTLAGTPGAVGSANGTGSAARFNAPAGIAVDAAGDVYVADTGNHTIRKIAPGQIVTLLAGRVGKPGTNLGTGTTAQFNAPLNLAVDALGNVYVADSKNSRICSINPGGTVNTLAGKGDVAGSADGQVHSAHFNLPAGIAIDAVGNIYVTELGNKTVRKILPSDTSLTLAGVPGVVGSQDGSGAAASFNAPAAIAVDAQGQLYVADSGNDAIRLGTPPAPPPFVEGPATAVAFAGQALTLTITNSGVATSYSASPLPVGLTLNSSSGTIAGSVAAPGTYTIALTAANAFGESGLTLTLTVAAQTAAVTLGNLSQVFTGAGLSATATTNPPGLPVTFTYNGNANPPRTRETTRSWRPPRAAGYSAPRPARSRSVRGPRESFSATWACLPTMARPRPRR